MYDNDKERMKYMFISNKELNIDNIILYEFDKTIDQKIGYKIYEEVKYIIDKKPDTIKEYYETLKPTIENFIVNSTETMYKQLFLIVNDIIDLINSNVFDYIYYKPINKIISINKFIAINVNNKKIKLLVDKLLLKKYNFNIEYLYNNVDFSNDILQYILNNSEEKHKNILYKFLNVPIKFDKIITELNIDPNNKYNLIGVLGYIGRCTNNPLLVSDNKVIYYNLALKHGFKFPNFLSFLIAYTLFKEIEKSNIETLNNYLYDYLNTNDEDSKINIYNFLNNNYVIDFDNINKQNLKITEENSLKITEKLIKDYYNSLPKDVNNDHELFEIIYDNPFRSYEFDEAKKYTDVSKPYIFTKKIFDKEFKQLVKLYDIPSNSSELYEYLEQIIEEYYDEFKGFVDFC